MEDGSKSKRNRRAATPEARENQIIADAYDLAEERIRNGTASNQLIIHFLRAGSSKERAELEKLKKEKEVLEAKVESYKSMKNIEELYSGAIQAMRSYQGSESELEEDPIVYGSMER